MSKSCEWMRPRMTRYLDGELLPEERAAFEGHLRECPQCEHVFDSLRQLDRIAGEATGTGGDSARGSMPSEAGEAREFGGFFERFQERFDLDAAAAARSEEMDADRARRGSVHWSPEQVAETPLEDELFHSRRPSRKLTLPRLALWRWGSLVGAAAAAVIVVVVLSRQPDAPGEAVRHAMRGGRSDEVSFQVDSLIPEAASRPDNELSRSELEAAEDAGRTPAEAPLAVPAAAPSEALDEGAVYLKAEPPGQVEPRVRPDAPDAEKKLSAQKERGLEESVPSEEKARRDVAKEVVASPPDDAEIRYRIEPAGPSTSPRDLRDEVSLSAGSLVAGDQASRRSGRSSSDPDEDALRELQDNWQELSRTVHERFADEHSDAAPGVTVAPDKRRGPRPLAVGDEAVGAGRGESAAAASRAKIAPTAERDIVTAAHTWGDLSVEQPRSPEALVQLLTEVDSLIVRVETSDAEGRLSVAKTEVWADIGLPPVAALWLTIADGWYAVWEDRQAKNAASEEITTAARSAYGAYERALAAHERAVSELEAGVSGEYEKQDEAVLLPGELDRVNSRREQLRDLLEPR